MSDVNKKLLQLQDKFKSNAVNKYFMLIGNTSKNHFLLQPFRNIYSSKTYSPNFGQSIFL